MANVFQAVGSAVADAATGGVGSLVEGGLGAIDKLIARWKANPTDVMKHEEVVQAAEDAREQARINFELQLVQAQTRINELEAQSGSAFARNWRPSIGWICGFGLGYTFIVQPFLAWGSLNWHWVVPPILNIDSLMTLLFGMLGLGAQRSFDKMKGTTK